ncbi:methionine synthase (B12-independent) [Prosthecobacter fusiformis]|uniref:5-methyltetrahydropteroyltriglutamate--homocysteine methyltransferase n=2 Tax=Prosthecobacter fusiformis TaxID=48464 RepID=A0A4R7SQK9_9BACT|nr:methionine synthase (B12-independent) [Prosthecobacter fusiformis]
MIHKTLWIVYIGTGDSCFVAMSDIYTHNLGYPRIGQQRELKKATESYWHGRLSGEELEAAGRKLREQGWATQKAAGIDLIPCNDFTFYDQMLDFSCLIGNVPPRFGWKGEGMDLDTLFLMARGSRGEAHDSCDAGCTHQPAFACEMTKWFDTNYHYLVPEFQAETVFKLVGDKVFREFQEAQALGYRLKPVLPGPVTYLSLGKVQGTGSEDFDRFSLLGGLADVYEEILQRLASLGAEWVQIDEPVFGLDLSAAQRDAVLEVWARLGKAAPGLKILVTSYFSELRENLPLFLSLPVQALHFDAVRGGGELDEILAGFPQDKILSLGVVDGRNIWKNDFTGSLALLDKAKAAVGAERLWVAPSCSLQHSPLTLANEPGLDAELKEWMAFADQKLDEVVTLGRFVQGRGDDEVLKVNQDAIRSRRESGRIHRAEVKARLLGVKAGDYNRQSPFAQRQAVQSRKLQLPEFPTTTIGSFPQTAEVRAMRARWKKGELSTESYEVFLQQEIRHCVAFQDEAGIDMPVHGEFERNDMVEYFGEQLEGFAFTQNGWVQSYGSRYVKPPVIFGDVSRPVPMTVRWSEFAQSLTERPMKGMLTGPVTILQWSFVRDDQPRSETTRQIALAIRDEVTDLEAAGIAAIQIDEPAIREGLPLRRSDWAAYLDWAVGAFRLCASGVRDETQIHTHMCYAEFNDIIDAIAALDADVITIETSRSNMELLEAFVDFKYPNEIGPGVYDIHSPRIPSVDEMVNLMRKAEAVIPRAQLWINPDCGLKTRGWAEVKPALLHLVAAARKLRAEKPVKA